MNETCMTFKQNMRAHFDVFPTCQAVQNSTPKKIVLVNHSMNLWKFQEVCKRRHCA